jgi:hypothetical protein
MFLIFFFQYFFTRPGYKITLHFDMMITSRNNSGTISVYDGSSSNEPLLAVIPITNNTRPQSITTLKSNVYVVYNSEPRVQTLALIKLVTGPRKYKLSFPCSYYVESFFL